MNSDELISHYECVLRDAEERKSHLQSQIADLQREARELAITIGGIIRLAPPTVAAKHARGGLQNGQIIDSQKFSDLSTRWAILLALSERSEPISIPDVAELLKAGGFSTDASNFNNNVSSVLSRMKTKTEVDVRDGLWFITEVGRSAIAYIKAQKLRRRNSPKMGTPETVAAESGELLKGDSRNGTALT